jgi:serine/threonine-protein kinase
MIGTVVGSYRIVEKLGEGGMGAVYRAVDQMVERSVAIKVLRPEIAQNPEVLERFRAEAVALARLNHHAIATLYSFFRDGEQYFMAMEFVPGETLEKRLQRDGAMTWQSAVEVLLAVLEGIRHAHQMGILHRDLKPANIMITPDGRVKVTDFGIARVLNTAGLTREARVVGTLEYLAPERALGRPADARSDLYSLGVVFYEMLTGHLPFKADSDFALMRAQIEETPVAPRQLGVAIPAEIEAALLKALAKDPEERYADAAAFAAEFREAMRSTGVPLVARPTRAEPSAATRQAGVAAPASAGTARGSVLRTRQARLAAIVAGGLALLAGAGFGVRSLLTPKPPVKVVNAPEFESLSAPATPSTVQPIAPPVVIPAPPEQAAPSLGAAPGVAPMAPKSAPTTAPPRPSRIPPPAASDRAQMTRAALDEVAGPLPLASIQKALKAGGAAGAPLITDAVQRRGVSFRISPDQMIELKSAGASDPLLQAILNGYRGAATPPAPPPAPTPAPVTPAAPPARRSITRLRDIHKLYIVPIEGEIDQYLREEIGSELAGRVTVVSSAAGADASLRIEVQDDRGNRVAGAAGRIFGVKSKRRAIVRIVEPAEKRVIWSAESGDKKAVLGAFGDGEKRLASRIAKQLRLEWER